MEPANHFIQPAFARSRTLLLVIVQIALSSGLVHGDDVPDRSLRRAVRVNRLDEQLKVDAAIWAKREAELMAVAEDGPLRYRVTWTRDERNPIFKPRPRMFDSLRCMTPCVLRDGDQYHMYYAGESRYGLQSIGKAVANVADLTNWTRSGPLFEVGCPGGFDARWCVGPCVVLGEPSYLYYSGRIRGEGLDSFPGIGLAVSHDGEAWERYADRPIIPRTNEPGEPDAKGIAGGTVLRLMKDNKNVEWRFYYTGCPTLGKTLLVNQQRAICLAVSNDGIHWERHGVVMLRHPEHDYEDIAVTSPNVHQLADGTFRMWYSAVGFKTGKYCICYAESDDGLKWRRGINAGENIVFQPTGKGWENDMVEYPSVIAEDDHLRMFYCGNAFGETGIGTATGVESTDER